MNQAQLAAGPDRLPWLADEPRAKPKRGANPALAAGVLVALATAAFWVSTHGLLEQGPAPVPVTVVKVPEARAPQPVSQSPEVELAPQPEVIPAPTPEVRPEPIREVRIAPAVPVKVERQQVGEAIAKPAPPPAIVAQATPLRPWPPRVIAGAAGRLVQVGAFGTRLQAKRGWWAMVRSYPAMARLPALVVETRNSRGRHFYRFQVGTTSQAHSEVLCQRMEKIRFSCAVIGLPWKPRGVER